MICAFESIMTRYGSSHALHVPWTSSRAARAI
jgi:hypothetical protein